MTAPERILTYIQKTYQPEAVVVYGSFADGSAGAGSDFDAPVWQNGTPQSIHRPDCRRRYRSDSGSSTGA